MKFFYCRKLFTLDSRGGTRVEGFLRKSHNRQSFFICLAIKDGAVRRLCALMSLYVRRRIKENFTAFVFIAPFLLVFLVFLGYPVIYSFILSLHKTTIYSNWYNKYSDMTWCGLEHYKELLAQDKTFWWSLIATFIYAALTIPTGIALALVFALVLNPKLKGFSFFRTGFFLPTVFDMFVVGVIWLFLYNPTDGLFIKVLFHKGIKPIVHSIAALVALGVFWLGPVALAWIAMRIARAKSVPLLDAGKKILASDSRIHTRFLIADAVILPFFILSAAGRLHITFLTGFLFVAFAIAVLSVLLSRLDWGAIEDATPGLRWSALIFGGIFFIEVAGTLSGAGPVNFLLEKPLAAADGFISELGAGFLGSPILVLPSIAIAVVLKGAGFGMILFLTAINNISPSVLEAAEIDGCTPAQRTRHIILPLVKPIILFLVIIGLVGALNAFTEIYSMTANSGGPSMMFFGTTVRAARISGYHLFRVFDDAFYGQAAAISYVLLTIALIISYINFRLLASRE